MNFGFKKEQNNNVQKKTKMFILFKLPEYRDSQAWWFTAVIPATQRLRKVHYKFKARLAKLSRPCLKNKIYKPEILATWEA
jgi:hypothetical protein